MEILKKIKCLFGKHDDILIHENNRHTIKQCRVCNKYEVLHKGTGLIYRCSWDELPYSYKY